MTDSDGEPDVFYVPGATNYYDYDNHVVVLDAHLKDYPLAHDYVLDHEIEHAERTTFVGLLGHELRTDVEHFFGDSEEVKEVREYYRNRPHGDASSLSDLSAAVVDFLRGWVNIVLRPVAKATRVVRGE